MFTTCRVAFYKDTYCDPIFLEVLTIEGEDWPPFLTFDTDENGTAINYRGIMWDLLMFMKKARNFTFTMVSDADGYWGDCYAVNNCTGMIGMVNRKEVDFALGKCRFTPDSEVRNGWQLFHYGLHLPGHITCISVVLRARPLCSLQSSVK